MIWNVFFYFYFLMKFVQSTAILIRGATFGGVGGAGSGGRGLTSMAHSHARTCVHFCLRLRAERVETGNGHWCNNRMRPSSEFPVEKKIVEQLFQ